MPPELPGAELSGKDVTVVVPAYRASATIGRALDSIAAQTAPPKRVIVVDDGSDDGTVAAAEARRSALNEIDLTLLTQDHKGPGAARNRALADTDTSLVAFLDADDEWLPEKLARSLSPLSDPGVTLVSHNMTVVSEGGETLADCARHLPDGADAFVQLFKRGFVATSTVVARTEPVRAAGGFDETLPAGQDYDLWLTLARDKRGIFVMQDPLTRYHVVAGSVTSNVARRRTCAVRIAARHAGALKGRAAFPFATLLSRVAIITYEALSAYWAKGQRLAAAGTALGFAPALANAMAHSIKGADARQTRAPERFSGSGSGGSDAENPMARARQDVETRTSNRQERNQLWWEELPMTYADWSEGDRVPRTRADFEAVRAALIGHSPFLRERYDFTAHAGRKVLDLGCGSGVTACLLAEGGADVTGADLTQAAVDMSRRAATAWGVPLRVARIDAEHSAFADTAFDYVFSWGVLHHTNDTDQAFREVCRILKGGGGGLIMVYHKASLVYYLKGLYWLLLRGKIFQGHGLESVQGFFVDGYYHRHYTRRTLRRALEAAGLTVDRVIVTQMQKKILPFIPTALDLWLKDKVGWLIIAEFSKP